MDPIFTEEQLNRMSSRDMRSLLKIMMQHQQKQEETLQKQEETLQKQESRIRLLEEQKKELEFLNAMLSDRLTLAQKKRFGASSEKYAEGYVQLGLFNEAEQEADPNAPEPDLEEVHPSAYKRKKRSGKKEEDLSSFETTEVIEYKLTGEDRYCPDCNTKYKVVTKETVKRLKFVPARFEVVEEVTFVYSCPKCGAMKRPEKNTASSERQRGNTILGGRHYERQVCKRDAACTPGAGIRPVQPKSFYKDHGKLDHPMCGPVSAAALRSDERRAAPE